MMSPKTDKVPAAPVPPGLMVPWLVKPAVPVPTVMVPLPDKVPALLRPLLALMLNVPAFTEPLLAIDTVGANSETLGNVSAAFTVNVLL